LKAGYSENTARVIGQEPLTKPTIENYIDEKMQELADKRIMGAIEALESLTSIVKRGNIEEVVVSTSEGTEKVDKIPDIKDRQRAQKNC